jgi:ABC-2 type transport system permease protein
MNLSFYLISTLFKASASQVFAPRRGRWLQLGSYLFALTVFLVGGYFLFHRIFVYLLALEELGKPLLFRLLSTAFLTFFLMLFLSNLITSLSTLYFSPEIDFLLATPMSPTKLFGYRFLQNVFFSTWATLILGLPLLAALTAARHQGLFHLLLYLAGLLTFTFLPAFLAVAALLLLIKLFPKMGLRQLLGSLMLVLALAAWAFFVFGQPRGIVIAQINTMPELERYLSQLALVGSPLLPSAWLARLVLADSPGAAVEILKTGWLLLITAVFLGSLCFFIADKIYYKALTTRLSASPERGATKRWGPTAWLADRLPIAAKDALLFRRDSTQWAQGLIFLSLLVIYLGGIRTYPLLFTIPVWKVAIAFLNFAFAGYILATLSVRFVFPVISLEGPMMWLMRSAPVSAKRLLMEKSALNLAVALLLTETLSFLSNRILNTLPQMRWLSHLSLGLMCLAITSLVLGLGAIFPDFKERNPSRIASGLGGLLAALAGLGYVGLSVVVLAWPAYLYAAGRGHHHHQISYGGALTAALGAFIVLSALVIWLPLKLGLRELERHEV